MGTAPFAMLNSISLAHVRISPTSHDLWGPKEVARADCRTSSAMPLRRPVYCRFLRRNGLRQPAWHWRWRPRSYLCGQATRPSSIRHDRLPDPTISEAAARASARGPGNPPAILGAAMPISAKSDCWPTPVCNVSIYCGTISEHSAETRFASSANLGMRFKPRARSSTVLH